MKRNVRIISGSSVAATVLSVLLMRADRTDSIVCSV